MRTVRSLVDLCVRVTVDNIKYLGDVGDLDNYLLERILSHCGLEQLKRIEDINIRKKEEGPGRDLSPVTDKFWKKAYTELFGVERTNIVVERMKLRKTTFTWRRLYEAKIMEQEKAAQESSDRIRQRYKEEDAKKQSRQIKVLTDVPPPPRDVKERRRFWRPDDDEDDTKSGIMKKAKREFYNCMEVKNRAAMRNKTVQRMNKYW